MRSLAIILSVLLVLFSLHHAQATIIHVPGDQPTIQAGINSAATGDTVLVSPGTYYEHISLSNILLKSESGAENTIISASGTGTVVQCSGYGILDGFTIRDGAGGYNQGGGITCEGCLSTIRNNIIRNNGGVEAGGIYCHDSDAKIENNIIYSNFSGTGTGGVAILGGSKDTVINNLIYGNSRGGEGQGAGGIALHVSDQWPTLVENNTIDYNGGDGIYSWIGGGMTIKNNIITHSSWGSPGHGYGIYFYQASSYVCEYNDVYGNYGGDYVGVVPGVGCFSADPLFCINYQDRHLYNTSPCIGAGENGVTIGALGIGCTVQYGVQVLNGKDKLVWIAKEDTLVFNIENIGLELDVYDISVADSLGWLPVPSQAQITLSPGTEDSIFVTFYVPSISFGTVNKVSLTATSQTLPSVHDSSFANTIAVPSCGDVNLDGIVELGDLVFLINYLYKGGSPPCER